ncbi:MAG: DUF2023 family protein [Candidatus Cryptobacteroides sp.]
MELNPSDMKVFLNHIYEFKKGVRRMVLYRPVKNMKIFACSVAVIATGSNAAAVIAFRISAVVFDDVVFV